MGPLDGLVYGFSVALTPTNLFACFVGVLVGTIVGILPGIGPVGAMALLLPSTFALQPATALIMLAGIYYGAMYGGSTTSILVNVPGEAGSVVTALDGYQMTRRAGPARRWRWRRWAPSSPAPSAWSASSWPPPGSPTRRSASARPSTSRWPRRACSCSRACRAAR